jgi:4-hydroxy-4-methyl-2-oxoglutarate aldolase
MATTLTSEHLDALQRFDAPTVANAIETFNVQPRNTGFMDSTVRCMFPDLGVMVGYACTAVITAAQEPPARSRVSREEWWRTIAEAPAPRVIVMQDIDEQPIGSFWGEVQGNIHKALGCLGVVTNGGVRDMNEARALGFHFFANAVLVSHAYVRLVEINVPVKVGGLIVRPGDVIHADQHGAQVVPKDLVPRIPEAVADVAARERRIIDTCQAPDFSLEKLIQVYQYI